MSILLDREEVHKSDHFGCHRRRSGAWPGCCIFATEQGLAGSREPRSVHNYYDSIGATLTGLSLCNVCRRRGFVRGSVSSRTQAATELQELPGNLMSAPMVPAYVIAALVAVGILVALVIQWNKTGRKRSVAMVVVAVLVIGTGLATYEVLRPKAEIVWVLSVPDPTIGGKILFEAPKSKGYAAGAAFSFESKASPDEVFEAFKAAYPTAKRVGDIASVMIDGHEYILQYEPSAEDHLPFTLYNEDTCAVDSPEICALFTNPTPRPLDPDA